MAHFTQNMKERLFAQGWKFSHKNYYEYNQEIETIYSNDKYPGVFISRSNSFGIYTYSDDLYNPESEKIIEAYNKGYNKGSKRGYDRGYNYGYTDARRRQYEKINI